MIKLLPGPMHWLGAAVHAVLLSEQLHVVTPAMSLSMRCVRARQHSLKF